MLTSLLSGHYFAERRLGPDENSGQRPVQHVCTSEQHHRVKRESSLPLATRACRCPDISQIYRTSDAPDYRTGNKVILGIIAWTVCLMISIKVYYMWRNASRDKIWSVMTSEERDEYLRTTKDQGNKRLDFRFAH